MQISYLCSCLQNPGRLHLSLILTNPETFQQIKVGVQSFLVGELIIQVLFSLQN
jgi:hypothetical protein